PQGMKKAPEGQPVPEGVSWDLWLGPAAERPYNGAYLPFVWRGWRELWTRGLGRKARHTANLPYIALNTTPPPTIHAEGSEINPLSFRTWARIRYEFPKRGDLPPCTLTWYEGRKDGKLVLPPESVLKDYKQPEKGYTVLFKDDRVMQGDAQNNKLRPVD